MIMQLASSSARPQAVVQARNAPAGVSGSSLKPRVLGAGALQRGGISRSRTSGRVGSPQIVAVGDVGQDDFEAKVLQASSKQAVLVDFWATWCGPCKLVAPLMDVVEEEYGDAIKVLKVEADPNPELVEKYKVYGLPALVLFKDGQVAAKHEGAIGKKKLAAWLESNGMAKVAAA